MIVGEDMSLYFSHRKMAEQKGQILALVLILMLLIALILAPLLDYISTSLKVHQLYDRSLEHLYSADAGIEDALWQIKFAHLNTTLLSYDEYDYETIWHYSLSNEDGTGQINQQDVDITIQNAWVPQNIPKPIVGNNPIPGQMIPNDRLVINGTTIQTGINDLGNKISQYKIRVTYYRHENEVLNINTLGIWLPPGFNYYSRGSAYRSNLENNIIGPYYKAPDPPHQWAGGTIIFWNWGSNPIPFTNLPNVVASNYPLTTEITFYFQPDPDDPSKLNDIPDIVPWTTTSVTNVAMVPYSWDSDVKIYKITSKAGDTTIESVASISTNRQIQTTTAGDYYATGNSALSDTDGDYYRETTRNPSYAVVDASKIPQDADVAAAYLYWTGWENDNSLAVKFTDSCDNFMQWDLIGNNWSVSSGKFLRQGDDVLSENTLTMNSSLDLSSCLPGAVVISWVQTMGGNLDANDCLSFALFDGEAWSSDIVVFRGPHNPSSNFTYVIPDRFMVAGFRLRISSKLDKVSEYIFLDDIKITAMEADTSVIFKIDDGTGPKQVYIDATGMPQQGNYELIADKGQVLRNYSGVSLHSYSYSSFCDVTSLVRTYCQSAVSTATNIQGYATYWVGDIYADLYGTHGGEDEWAYACWSLIIIYNSSQTQGHRIYIYDKFIYSNQNITYGVNVDFDGDGEPGGTISGFIIPESIQGEVNAGKLTAFIGEGDPSYIGDSVSMNGIKLWDGTATSQNSRSNPNNIFNSTSIDLGTYEGIDIDTLGIDPPNGRYITWDSNILQPGDTSAHIDMVTFRDVWNMVYIIFSFRTSITGGDILSYTIHKN
jgi:hypothetical protein